MPSKSNLEQVTGIEEENLHGKGATALSTPRRDPAPQGGGRTVVIAAAAGSESLKSKGPQDKISVDEQAEVPLEVERELVLLQ